MCVCGMYDVCVRVCRTVAEKQITRWILNGNAATAVLLTYRQSRLQNNITFIDSI